MKAKIVIPSSDEIAQKGNGRIFVQTEEEIEKVKQIIKEIDPNEYKDYFPTDFVAVFNKDGDNNLIYSHKFDINVGDLIGKCREKDIYIVVYSCNDHNYDDMLTLETALERRLGVRSIGNFEFGKTKNW